MLPISTPFSEASSLVLHVDHQRWSQSKAHLRDLVLNASHARSRERFLARHDIAQGAFATAVAERTGRHPQTVWTGCTTTMNTAPRHCCTSAAVAAPLCPEIEAALAEAIRTAQRRAASPPVAGADPKPRWTLRRLVGLVRDRYNRRCCRETIRTALQRLDLSWKKAKKLLGRAKPERRKSFLDKPQTRTARADAGSRRGCASRTSRRVDQGWQCCTPRPCGSGQD